MSIINEVRMTNFRQYRGKHNVKFTKKLNLIIGENDAGKTGIFLAILYGLYKHTGRNRSPKAYISYGSDNMEIKVDYTSLSTNSRYRVTRNIIDSSSSFIFEKMNPKSGKWELELAKTSGTKEDEVNKKVEETIGLSKKAFLNIVYTEQKRFYDIVFGGSGVKNDLDNILGIKAFILLEQSLRNKSKSFKEEIKIKNDLETQFSSLAASIENIKNELDSKEEFIRKEEENLRELEKNWNNIEDILIFIKKIEIESMLEDFETLKSNNEALQKNITALATIEKSGSLEELEKRLKEFKTKKGEFSTTIKELQNKLTDIEKTLGVTQYEKKQKRSLIESMDQTSGLAMCPKCRQKVSKEHLVDEIKKEKQDIIILEKKLSDLQNNIENLKKSIEEEQSNYDSVDRGVFSLSEKINQMKYYQEKNKELENVISKRKKELNTKIKTNYEIIQQVLTKDFREPLKKKLSLINDHYEITSFKRDYNILNECFFTIKESSTKTKLQISHLEDSCTEKKKDIHFLRDMYEKNAQDKQRIKRKLDKISKIERNIQRFLKGQNVLGALTEEVRDLKLRELAKRTYYWYSKLISNIRYKNVVIDKENYELKVIPIADEEDNEYSSRTNVGGGNETILALAERIALIELFNYRGIVLFDEPTDAMDTENINTFIEGINRLTNEIPQLILITHHNIGIPYANNVIRVKTDSENKCSFIS